ncbi:MAG: PEGA domain-containing protein [Candidatus Eisenbacteria sp.]|nr:PEGA domain-containing protein [Candidatus Eisenbacteria bacterium]
MQAPATGFLAVFSEPPGASIEIDGDLREGRVTPDTLELTTGAHAVRVFLDNHEALPAESEVNIEKGRGATAEFCLFLTGATGASRTVLIEHFGNVRCEPCGPAEILMRDFQESLGADHVLTFGYRTNWPASQDPVYVENPALHGERIAFYSISVAPTIVFDGISTMSIPTEATLQNMYQQALATPPHFWIEVSDTLDGFRYSVGARVAPLDCPMLNDLVIQFGVVETEVVVVLGPAEETSYNVVRDLMPNASGQAFSPVYGETLSFWRSRTLDAGWDESEIETVVFIQSRSTKHVLQSGSTFGTTPARR